MLSLSVVVASLIVCLTLTATAITLTSRAAGSDRRKWRTGWLTVSFLLLLNIAAGLASQMVGSHLPALGQSAIVGIWAFAGYTIIRGVYRLSAHRALIPFGAYVVIAVAQTVLFLAVVRPRVFETFRIPTVSMAPTLEPGDRFSVNKLARPRRWDVVVYWSEHHDRVVFCKRLAGLPGERLRFEDGKFYVNDKPVDAPAFVPGCLRAFPPVRVVDPMRYREGETITLGADEYFLLGDNAPLSADSRYYGPVRSSSLIGVVDLIYWPPKKWRILR